MTRKAVNNSHIKGGTREKMRTSISLNEIGSVLV
jgi:hypothetical protein